MLNKQTRVKVVKKPYAFGKCCYLSSSSNLSPHIKMPQDSYAFQLTPMKEQESNKNQIVMPKLVIGIIIHVIHAFLCTSYCPMPRSYCPKKLRSSTKSPHPCHEPHALHENRVCENPKSQSRVVFGIYFYNYCDNYYFGKVNGRTRLEPSITECDAPSLAKTPLTHTNTTSTCSVVQNITRIIFCSRIWTRSLSIHIRTKV